MSKLDARSIQIIAGFAAAAISYANSGMIFHAGRNLGMAQQAASDIDDYAVRQRADDLLSALEKVLASK
jgi:hypothetical protein